ncbi:MAG: hypothetical protein K2Q18_17990, partial [Bdellovibrionales bacterium]|nr:hypothetical protein [Bdellovibrionales bacterium]
TIELDAIELPYPSKTNAKDECIAFAIHRFDNCIESLDFFRIVMAQFLTDQKFLKRFQEDLLKFKTSTDFERRIQILIDAKKIVKEVSAKSVFNTIENYIFGAIIFKVIFEAVDINSVKTEIKEFAAIYGKGLEA